MPSCIGKVDCTLMLDPTTYRLKEYIYSHVEEYHVCIFYYIFLPGAEAWRFVNSASTDRGRRALMDWAQRSTQQTGCSGITSELGGRCVRFTAVICTYIHSTAQSCTSRLLSQRAWRPISVLFSCRRQFHPRLQNRHPFVVHPHAWGTCSG